MRRLLLAGDDADFDLLEAGRFEPAMQIALGKAEPAVAVELVRLLEVVLGEVENHDLAARLEDAVGAARSPWPGPRRDAAPGSGSPDPRCSGSIGGFCRSPRRNSRFFRLFFFALAAPKATIFSELSTAMTFLQRRASSSLSRPFARAQVGHDQRRQNAQQQVPEGLPGPARARRPGRTARRPG